MIACIEWKLHVGAQGELLHVGGQETPSAGDLHHPIGNPGAVGNSEANVEGRQLIGMDDVYGVRGEITDCQCARVAAIKGGCRNCEDRKEYKKDLHFCRIETLPGQKTGPQPITFYVAH